MPKKKHKWPKHEKTLNAIKNRKVKITMRYRNTAIRMPKPKERKRKKTNKTLTIPTAGSAGTNANN